MDCVVALLFHKYDCAAFAVNVTVPPIHTAVAPDVEIVATGVPVTETAAV